MNNIEVIKWLNKNRACISYDCNKENADNINNAIDYAIKAIRIVEVTENCFIHNRGEGLIDRDDWEDIKKFVEKEAENDNTRR